VKNLLKRISNGKRNLVVTGYGTSRSRELAATCSGAVVEVLRRET